MALLQLDYNYRQAQAQHIQNILNAIWFIKGEIGLYDKRWQPDINILEIDPNVSLNDIVVITCAEACKCQCQGCGQTVCQHNCEIIDQCATCYETGTCIKSCIDSCISDCETGVSCTDVWEYCGPCENQCIGCVSSCVDGCVSSCEVGCRDWGEPL